MATWIDRTQTSGNRQKFTYSAWIKFTGNLATYAHLATTNPNPGNWDTIRLHESRKFEIICNNNNNILRTSRVFRDTNAWYHFVVAVDTTQSTATNRTKLYVNGVQETSFESTGYPPQNHNTNFNTNSQTFRIGHNTWSTGGGEYFAGLMSHVHWIDGTAYDASAFGSTDSTTGEWKINTSPSVTYGTNGFFIFKDSQSITDQSGNSNNFTVASGTLTKTEDNPSNVFATFNPLIKATTTFSNGNTTGQTQNSSNYLAGMSTLGMPRGSGIYYCEIKLISESATGESCIGVASEEAFTLRDAGTLSIVGADYNWGIRNANGLEYYDGGSGSSKHGNFAAGDIMGVYFDSTNDKLTYSKNGGWWNGTSSWSGTSPDLTNYFVGTSSGSYQTFFFNCGDSGNSVNAKWSANFGNGYFGTTAVSSAGTNTSGQIGIFEYNMPTNSKVLSTKGLNT